MTKRKQAGRSDVAKLNAAAPTMKTRQMNFVNAGLVAAFALVSDQMSKWLVLALLDLPSTGPLVLLPGFLKFALVWNTGVNFGLLSSRSMLVLWSLVAMALLVSAGMLWWIRHGADVYKGLGVGLIVGGALGNALDRVVHGAVVDFVNVSAFGINNPFSFNIADIWVIVGAAFIMISGSGEPSDKHGTDRQSLADP